MISVNNTNASDQNRLRFSEEIKKRWIVQRDGIGDEYIALNGKTALGKNGSNKEALDHIYLIGESKAGLWITAKQLKQKINALRKKVPSLKIEQLGDIEATCSVPIEDLDSLCKAVKAKKRRKISERKRQQLREIAPIARSKKALIKQRSNEPRADQLDKEAS